MCFYSTPVFEAMACLPRSMASSLVALPRSCHDLAMILARMPWPCKIVQRLTMINHDLGNGSMVTLAVVYEFPIRTSQIFLKKNVDYFFKNYEYQTNREFGPVKYFFLKKMLIIFFKKINVFFTTNC